jgi:hypothetical protein
MCYIQSSKQYVSYITNTHQKQEKGGETGSTGVVEALAACRGSYRLVKKVGKNIIADDYNYAVAA